MKALFITSAAFLMATSCLAWGQKGHDTTCAIAQNHLTETAKQQISAVLDGKSIVYWSNWLDNASNTPEYAYSKTWHYKNVNADQNYDEVKPFPQGDIVTALNEQVNILLSCQKRKHEAGTDLWALKAQESLALKMVIHLLGDVHQPMHMGHATDLGGNRVMLNFFRTEANLHGVWDTKLVESAHAWSHTEWVEELDRLSPEEQANVAAGTIDDWARETATLTAAVYYDSPEGSNLSYDYVAKWTPIVEQQFIRGGIRLAGLLNYIYAN